MSSSSGGFWPGEAPADDDSGDEELAVTEPEAEEEPVADPVTEPEPEADPEAEAEADSEPEPEPEADAEPDSEPDVDSEPDSDSDPGWRLPESPPEPVLAHRPGEIDVPAGVAVIEGAPFGSGRSVGIVVARFNAEISNGLLESALEALAAAGVEQERITVMVVPGAFELPLAAKLLARTKRYACVIGLGCVIRGETSHFDFVAAEAASGLQLAALDHGVPVAFGVLTVDTVEQAEARLGRGGDAARAGLEMADIFSQVRAQVRASGG